MGKPIIPLLMEQITWPPAGAMGPIFSEYLYVKFFQSSGEQTADECYWPSDKFQELLMQLRYHIAPDQSLITDGSSLISALLPPSHIAGGAVLASVCLFVSIKLLGDVHESLVIDRLWKRRLNFGSDLEHILNTGRS